MHTYLLTHGAEPFLKRRQLCSHSRTCQLFMETECSLPCSQEPSIVPILSHINPIQPSHPISHSHTHDIQYTSRITGFSDSVHRPVVYKLENTVFRKLDMFPSAGEWETPTLLGPLERSNLNHPFSDSPDDGNRSSFRSVLFSSNSECYTLSSEPFRICRYTLTFSHTLCYVVP
jgi:hypothetical protein